MRGRSGEVGFRLRKTFSRAQRQAQRFPFRVTSQSRIDDFLDRAGNSPLAGI